jgi:hypothetical protein
MQNIASHSNGKMRFYLLLKTLEGLLSLLGFLAIVALRL